MTNILKSILKYKWILAIVIVVIMFFYFSKNIESFGCGNLGKDACQQNNSQCSWQWQKGSRVSKPRWGCVNK